MNILLIPQFYPTLDKPLLGSFFKEQGELVNIEHDVRVLYLRPVGISFFNFLYYSKVKRKKYVLANDAVGNLKAYNVFYWKVNFNKTFIKFLFKSSKADELIENIKINSILRFYEDFIMPQFKTDIIHAHCTVFAGVVAYKLSQKYSIPYSITEHNYFNLSFHSDFEKQIIKTSLENAQSVMVVSAFLKKQILLNEINCNPLIVGNLVNEKLFPLLIRNAQKKREFKILTYTYLAWKNDVETLFQVILTIKNMYKKKFSFVIVVSLFGQKENAKYFIQKLNEFDLNNIVEIKFDVPREEMYKIMHISDIYLCTSVVETFGITPCEALCTGIPIVCTDNGGSDEYLDDSNGVKVISRDVKSIVAGIISICGNLEKYNSEEIRNNILKKYGVNAFKKIINYHYKSFIG